MKESRVEDLSAPDANMIVKDAIGDERNQRRDRHKPQQNKSQYQYRENHRDYLLVERFATRIKPPSDSAP
jgi:hypothetical protein